MKLILLGLIWLISAFVAWVDVRRELKNCYTRKHLYVLLALGVFLTITGPAGWLIAMIWNGTWEIWEKYKELREK